MTFFLESSAEKEIQFYGACTGSGTVFGVLLWAASGSMDPGIHGWLRLVAHGYVSLFACLVIPMIFLASIRLVLRIPTETQVSKLTKYKKWVNTLMMAISATIASVMGLVFRFGAMPGTESIVFDWNAGQNLFSQIAALIPSGADGTRVKTALFDEKNKHAEIVGAGFIGLEVAEACRRYGKEVTVVELAPRILTSFDPEISEALTGEMEKNGVKVCTAWNQCK